MEQAEEKVLFVSADTEQEKECAVTEEEKSKDFLHDNRGVGVVEVILILVVLIALVLIFKDKLGEMVTKALGTLETTMNEVLS